VSAGPTPKKPISPPKGTRDLYPEDALRRRYVQQAWRDASIRCGFDEIAGPTFETSDLYAVKSGEGILGELFQAFSGKSPDEVEQVRESGRAPYALRPEFTPTLARMYAAKAGSLPKPCKWFTAGPYFRAERPQRGRLREFEQWNVDVIGDDSLQSDLDLIATAVTMLEAVGLTSQQVQIRINHREFVEEILRSIGVAASGIDDMLNFLDRTKKMDKTEFIVLGGMKADEHGFDFDAFEAIRHVLWKGSYGFEGNLKGQIDFLLEELPFAVSGKPIAPSGPPIYGNDLPRAVAALGNLARFTVETKAVGFDDWVSFDHEIVRGLAYYTGTVFEVIAEGERAVAGGGRYDKLIELMGGPPTPAVGFAMGDVVLSLLLDDKGLMPEGPELADAVSCRPASVRPDVFVVGADDEATDPLVRRLAADLRRGVESDAWKQRHGKPWDADRYAAGSPDQTPDTGAGVQPLHARVSYKSTRNLKKLLADGEKQRARFAAVVHGADRVQVRDLDARRELTPADLAEKLGKGANSAAEFSVDPESPMYVGRAVQVL